MIYPITDMASRLAHIIMKVVLPVFLLFLTTSSVQAAYNVAGYVVDAKTGQNIAGSANPSIFVYADNSATVYKSYPDNNGYWQITNLADGPHSIEIANAGSMGWAPASAEKIQINSARSDLSFRLMRGGYDVAGRVVDNIYGGGVGGLTMYADFPGRTSATTDASGNYRLTNLSFGGAGHTIYVQAGPGGWEVVAGQSGIVVNPAAATSEVRADFIVRNTTNQPVQPAVSCAVSVQNTSGNISPVYVTLAGNFTSNNPGLYYPIRYEWDFNGDSTTDIQTPSGAFWLTSPQGTIYTSAQPKLKVYYNGSVFPALCTSPTTIYINPAQLIPINPPQNPGGTTSTPYCTVSASPTYGTTPFYSTISGNFYNLGPTYYEPVQYRFFVGYANQTLSSRQFQYSYSQYLPSSGSYPVRLEITHSAGSTITCYGPTITVNQYQNPVYPVILGTQDGQRTTLSSASPAQPTNTTNAATATTTNTNQTAPQPTPIKSGPTFANVNHTTFSTLTANQPPVNPTAAINAASTNQTVQPITNTTGFGAIITQANSTADQVSPNTNYQNISLAPQTGNGTPSVLETFAHLLSGAISIFVRN